jgi:hypothetical protein
MPSLRLVRAATLLVSIVGTICGSGCAARLEPRFPIETRNQVLSRHARGQSFNSIFAQLAAERSMVVALVTKDPANTANVVSLGIVHQEIGDLQLAMHDPVSALCAYRAELSIFEALSARDPSDPDMRRRVALGHSNLGDARLELGDRVGALAEYGAQPSRDVQDRP